MTSYKRFEIFYFLFSPFIGVFISVWTGKQNLYSKKKLQIATACILIYFISNPPPHPLVLPTFRRCYLHLVLLASSRKKISKLVKPTRKRFHFLLYLHLSVFIRAFFCLSLFHLWTIAIQQQNIPTTYE
jgi:hypothetical protein